MAESAPKEASAQKAWAIPTPEEFGLWSGFEGREEILGRGLMQLLKTIIADQPYQHHMNDAALKATLTAIHFAKNKGLLEDFVQHDIDTLAMINQRVGKVVEETGNAEYGMIALFERTDCWYQTVLDYKVEPGKRTWLSPYKTVLEMGTRIGQFYMTEQQIHQEWTKPRILGYAENTGIKVNVSDWQEDGWLSCELV